MSLIVGLVIGFVLGFIACVSVVEHELKQELESGYVILDGKAYKVEPTVTHTKTTIEVKF